MRGRFFIWPALLINEQAASECGFKSFVMKPILIDQMAKTISNVIAPAMP
jgi:hypothetical protein